MRSDGNRHFSIESTVVDNQVVLRLKGELDAGTAGLLAEAAEKPSARAVGNIVLDLSSLDFVDSSGLHQFVAVLRRQRQVGGNVILRSPTKHTLRVLEIVGLTQVFTVE